MLTGAEAFEKKKQDDITNGKVWELVIGHGNKHYNHQRFRTLEEAAMKGCLEVMGVQMALARGDATEAEVEIRIIKIA